MNDESGRPRRCVNCRYDLQGNDSRRCPECGMPESFPIEISDPVQFHRAKAVLEDARLLIRSREPGGVIGTLGVMLGGRTVPGVLWVDGLRKEEAFERINATGIVMDADPIPIVDVEAPFCPACDQPVATDAEPVCPECHTEFMWVDIEEGSRDGLICRDCGYDLTGTESDSCPECGRVVVPEPDREDHGTEHFERPRSERFAWILPAIACYLYVLFLVARNSSLNQDTTLLVVLVLLPVVIVLVVMMIRRRTG